MKLFSSDCEVFLHDWIFIFKEYPDGEHIVFHNDPSGLREFLQQEDSVLVFFNGKHYDQFVLRTILAGADNRKVKEINDFIISEQRRGWEHWFIKENRMHLNICDVRDDMYPGLSLKAIEGHMGLPIVESSVDFTIDRPLTPTEVSEVIEYCKSDVEMTERLIRERVDYLSGKIDLAELKGIDSVYALSLTNAKLVAVFLGAKAKEWYDEREYEYPKALNKDEVPREVIAFFDQLYDETISSEELFSKKLTYMLGDLEVTYGFGGVHAGLKCYIEEVT